MGPILVEAFRYHRWANLHLLDICGEMTEEQLQLTAPGTYGTLAATLQHMLDAERWYLWRLGGQVGGFRKHHKFSGLAALRKLANVQGDQLIDLAKRARGQDVLVEKYGTESWKVDTGLILVQALHHGNDHRTHVCTILGANGIGYGEMDVWAYGDVTGAMVQIHARA